VTYFETDRVLIIGASSHISQALIDEIKQFEPKITSVTRSALPLTNLKPEKSLSLDLHSSESVDSLLSHLSAQAFDYIYIFSGAVSGLEINRSSISETIKYYDAYGARLNYLIGQLNQNLKDSGTLIFISSRAAHKPSYDAHYSAIKASTEAFIVSIAQKFPLKRFLVLAPSLIQGTRIYEAMSVENIAEHKRRTNDSLLTLNEIVQELIKMSLEKDQYLNGTVTTIGRDW
jgi:NADP-dependent 3-hydroxy acid dehydrogenase YdfG